MAARLNSATLRRIQAVAGSVALCGFGSASAQNAQPAHLTWVAGPSPADIAESLSAKAAEEGAAGRAAVLCKIQSSGALSDCTVQSEEPGGYGFGETSIRLASKMRLVPEAGLPGEVTLPFRFEQAPPLRAPVFKPTPREFNNLAPVGGYYPEMAMRRGVMGRVLAECHLSSAGALNDCHVLSEEPVDFGFKEAFLRMAQVRYLTAKPKVVDGQPVADEVVRLLVPFRIRSLISGHLR